MEEMNTHNINENIAKEMDKIDIELNFLLKVEQE